MAEIKILLFILLGWAWYKIFGKNSMKVIGYALFAILNIMGFYAVYSGIVDKNWFQLIFGILYLLFIWGVYTTIKNNNNY